MLSKFRNMLKDSGNKEAPEQEVAAVPVRDENTAAGSKLAQALSAKSRESQIPEREETEGEVTLLGTFKFSTDAILVDPRQILGEEFTPDLSIPMEGMWDVWGRGVVDHYEEIRLTPHEAGDLDEQFVQALFNPGEYQLVHVGNVGVDGNTILISDLQSYLYLDYERDVDNNDAAASVTESGIFIYTGGIGNFPVTVLVDQDEDILGILMTIEPEA